MEIQRNQSANKMMVRKLMELMEYIDDKDHEQFIRDMDFILNVEGDSLNLKQEKKLEYMFRKY